MVLSMFTDTLIVFCCVLWCFNEVYFMLIILLVGILVYMLDMFLVSTKFNTISSQFHVLNSAEIHRKTAVSNPLWLKNIT
jgi:hypothetical protein